jgi:hypothetical protein
MKMAGSCLSQNLGEQLFTESPRVKTARAPRPVFVLEGNRGRSWVRGNEHIFVSVVSFQASRELDSLALLNKV